MLAIESSLLSGPLGDYAAIAAQVSIGEDYFTTLVNVNYGTPDTLVIANSTNLLLPQGWNQVTAIVVNGQTLTPATDPASPEIGEFVYNPYTNTIQIFIEGDPLSILAYGSTQLIEVSPPLASLPAILSGLPIQGTIQISGELEQHPSAQFELESTLPKSFLEAVFRPGGEIQFDGIAFRVNSVQIRELPRTIYPDSRCNISVSLGSKWENYTEDACFLLGGTSGSNDEPFQDPDCLTQNPPDNDTNVNTGATIAGLLSKIKIPYIGPALPLVAIPDDTPNDAAVNPVQLMEERVRIANSFIRWSNPQGVEVVPINGLKTWNYQESEILGEVETSYEAIARPSKSPISFPDLNPPLPDLLNFPATTQQFPIPQLSASVPTALGFEYPNVELTGEFSEPKLKGIKEKTQADNLPKYTKKPVEQVQRIVGDVNAHIPLAGVIAIQVMSLCFDIGGQVKTRSFITEEAGASILVVDETWGFAYYADEIYNEGLNKISGNPIEHWKCIKKTTTSYTYDPETGYLLYIITSGYNTARYREENTENPETLILDPSEDADEYSLYKFIQIPVIERTSYYLKRMKGADGGSPFEVFKQCNQDGTSSPVVLFNPNYAPRYYIEYERTESTAFASRSNPENEDKDTDSDEKFAPNLIIGEESRFESYTQVIPAEYQKFLSGFEGGYPVYTLGEEIHPQKFIRYIKKFKAEGQAIASSLEEIYTETGTGELPTASRRPPLYIREEPYNPDDSNEDDPNQPQYRHLIQTDGYTASDPVNGSENFNAAQTFAEAITAAKCKLAIENWRNGFTETLQIAGNPLIREGDRFNYWTNGQYRQRIVTKFSTTREILGVIDGVPRATTVTDLTLGPWVLPSLSSAKIPIPPEPSDIDPFDIDITLFEIVKDGLGSVLDWTTIQSRRNPLF